MYTGGKTVLTMLEQLASPVTEATVGLGRYVKQKFDNMVDVEKARGATLRRSYKKGGGKISNHRPNHAPSRKYENLR